MMMTNMTSPNIVDQCCIMRKAEIRSKIDMQKIKVQLGEDEEDSKDIGQQQQQPNEIIRFGLRMAFSVLMHPYEYAKVLIQLGYEPMKAVTTTITGGGGRLILPNIHQYVKHIRQIDGFIGLYRGLGARLIGSICGAAFSGFLLNNNHNHNGNRIAYGKNDNGKSLHSDCNNWQQQLKQFLWRILYDGIGVTIATTVSQPFYVISVRQMAQFVGRENIYDTIISSLQEILKCEGINGLYAGYAPRLLYNLCVLCMTSALGTICNRWFIRDQVQERYNAVVMQFGTSMIFYPFQLVGACMASTGIRLAACRPPFMPIYQHWTDCLVDLYTRGDHKRGAIPFYRYPPKIRANII